MMGAVKVFGSSATRGAAALTRARRALSVGVAAVAAGVPAAATGQTWEPSAPVEFIVPAGTGGGADQMARFVQKLVTDHRLMKQPMTVVNMPGNSGVDGLLAMKAAKGDPHKLIITLSNLFTSPLATGVDVDWQDFTPVQMLALDQFVLWVNATSPHKTARSLLDALKQQPPGTMKLGGTGSKQEDQLISVLLETATSTRINYVPRRGGGDVARALAAGEVDMTVNNPIEGVKLWGEGAIRPLCVFDGRPLDYPEKVAGIQAWSDLPTCMSFGVPVQYLMLRGVFTTAGATPAQVAYYNDVLDKVRKLPEWADFMAKGAFKQSSMRGAEFTHWLDKANHFHRVLMREAKLKATPADIAAAASAASAPAPARRAR